MSEIKDKLVITQMDPNVNEQAKQHFKALISYVQVGPHKCILSEQFERGVDDYFNFQIRSDDTFVISHPRSGTTVTQELVWLVSNNADLDAAKSRDFFRRFPYLEYSLTIQDVLKKTIQETDSTEEKKRLSYSSNIIDMINKMPSPRFIKSHLPLELLPKNLLTCGAKVIYVARNPKDVAVSYYYFSRLWKVIDFVGDFKTFWDYFEKELTPYSPYWAHVIEAWKRRNEPNLLFLFYEDFSKNSEEYVSKIAKFLNKPIHDDQLKRILEHMKIENFRKYVHSVDRSAGGNEFLNPNEQPFIRKGKTGDWGKEFTPELLQRADKWIKENLKDTDLRFPI